jgi:geranylgeranyl pyrophosphate synthase
MASPVTAILDLRGDRSVIEAHLAHMLCRETMPDGGPVHEAMRYAVIGNAQRIRPVMALRVARMLCVQNQAMLRLAAAVELLHCASLIVDDLPCMDNEQERRGRPAVHIAYGEANALLAAFGLVALAARHVVDGEVEDADQYRLRRFQIALLNVMDVAGLIGGQSLDLALNGSVSHRHRLRVIELKTVPLFELAVRAGFALASISVETEARLISFGRAYGLAFQLTDDHVDGDLPDVTLLEEQLASVRMSLRPLDGNCHGLEELVDLLHAKLSKNSSCYR